MLTRCLIAAEFVFPFSVGVISPSSSPFVSAILLSLHLLQAEDSWPSALSARSFLQGFPFQGTVFQVCLRRGFTSLWFSSFWEGHTFDHTGCSVPANSYIWELWSGVWCSWFVIVCPLMQVLWLDQLTTSANPARCCGVFSVFAVFITNGLGSQFDTGSVYFQTPLCVFGVRGIASCVPQHHV